MPAPTTSESTCCGLIALIVCVGLAGCRAERSLQEVEQEMRSLDVLYLTAESGARITAPATRGVFVDEGTGELCYPAYTCVNPDCPGGKSGEQPFLFIHRDVMLRAGPGGTVVRDEFPPGRNPLEVIESRGGFANPTCPACWEQRRGVAETPARRQQFVEWARPYTLPRTEVRRRQLEAEYRRKAAARR